MSNTEEVKSADNRFVTEALAEAKEAMESKIRKTVLAMLLNRKRLVREMEALDNECSAIDLKIQNLTEGCLQGLVIQMGDIGPGELQQSDVRAFKKNPRI